MILKARSSPFAVLLLLKLCMLCHVGCNFNESPSPDPKCDAVVCVVLAHPDDETIIGGTLTMLAEKGCKLHLVYITSGDDGPDMSCRGLHGIALAEEREDEAKQALLALGIQTAPVFLKYPDGHIYDHHPSITDTISYLFGQMSPQIVITFGPDGITGAIDHQYAGSATDSAFIRSNSGSLLLHMAVTKPLSPFYARGIAVPKDSVDIRVNVSKYRHQRIGALGAHHTQFNKRVQSAYKIYVHTMRKERFTIANNRGNTEWLEKYF